jgi:lycopene cyclase CruP
MTQVEQILSSLPGDVLGGLCRADALWTSYREGTVPVPTVVQEDSTPLGAVEWDVVICGGTLGVFVGAALAQLGWRVALIERGVLRGREQEWNISRKELQVFRELNLLSDAELEQAIATEYNPARICFHNGVEVWVRDVLNVGVDPVFLLETLKTKFLQAGGHLFEHTAFESVTVHPDGINVKAGQDFRARLVLDVMGHFSAIARQARQGRKPDAVCMVVGTCAAGFPENTTGDLFASFTPIKNQCQYFWEAFPARDGRTTYLFTYLDAHPDRPSLKDLFADYFQLLPQYQGVEVKNLQFKRALFGFFPCYRQSPLRSPWNRILHIGDSSGNQSPLSFGGFGAMLRHLQRLTQGIHAALETDQLDHKALALLQPYQPNLSVTWLFQRSMSVGVNQTLAPNQINQLLSAVFQVMSELGNPILKPFLQDIVQFPALFLTLAKTTIRYPLLVVKIIPQVGIGAILVWMVHYINLGIYTALNMLGQFLQPWSKSLPPVDRYGFHRWLDTWHYGSGADYEE